MTTAKSASKPPMKPHYQWLVGIAVVVGMIAGIGFVGKLTSAGAKPVPAASPTKPSTSR